MDRLRRETNPSSGFKRAVLPQHQGTDGSPAVTGHDNPLPSANYTQNESGVWLPVSKDNPVPTQVTGSNAVLPYKTVELSIVGQELPAGASKTSTFDVGGYRKATMIVVFSEQVKSQVTLANTIIGTWAGNESRESGSSSNRIDSFNPIGGSQAAMVTNNDDKPVTINRARVVAQ